MRLMMIALLAWSAFGQTGTTTPTQIRQSQIKEPAVTKPSVRLTMPDGKVIYAVLDSTLTLDTTVSPPVLRAASGASTTQRSFLLNYRLTRNSDGSMTLPPGDLVVVWRNGLSMTEGRDYTLTGRVLKTIDPSIEPDEILSCLMAQTAKEGTAVLP